MMRVRRWTALLTAAVWLVLLSGCAGDYEKEESSMTEQMVVEGVRALTYPAGAVKTLKQRGMTVESFVSRAADTGYDGQRHMGDTNIVVSPDYTAFVGDSSVPVYAAPVYVYDGNRGTLHSFITLEVAQEKLGESKLVLIAAGGNMSGARVYGAASVIPTVSGDTLVLPLEAYGTYTVTPDDTQDRAVTVFVRELADEEKEIADLRKTYGEDGVTVFEPGLHHVDPVLISDGKKVVYLKTGSLLLPTHTVDIGSDEDNADAFEENAGYFNSLGLKRFSVVNADGVEGIRILGRGTVDMSDLDWHERRGLVFCNCADLTVSGVTVINPCEWAMIFYRCRGVTLNGCAVLGYRTNSDAYAVCNCEDVRVTDCFARTGDDMFEVKTLGGPEEAVSRNITFSRCQAWGSKARCFGITGEVERDISDVVFEDSIVICRDAVWDNDRIGSLVVIREQGKGRISRITFRRMQIVRDDGRAINCVNYSADITDGVAEGILFDDIVYNASMVSQIKQNGGAGNRIAVVLGNVTANGQPIVAGTAADAFISDTAGAITVK